MPSRRRKRGNKKTKAFLWVIGAVLVLLWRGNGFVQCGIDLRLVRRRETA